MFSFAQILALLLLPSVQADSDAAARALAQSMRQHDLSIETLEWDQQIWSIDPNAPSETAAQLGWDGRFGEDRQSNWYWWGRQGQQSAPGSQELTYVEVRYTSNAEETAGWTVDQKSIGIRPPTDEPRFHPSPTMAIGRWVDIWGTRSLADLLLEAPVLRVHDVAADEGLVTLRAHTTVDNRPTVLLVTIDQNHGYAPRAIRIFNELENHLMEERVVDEYVQFEGVWIPESGTRVLYSRLPLSQEQDAALQQRQKELAQELGLDVRDPEVRKRASGEILGKEGWPVKILSDRILRFEVTKIHSLNEGLDPDYTVFVIPEDVVVVNTKTGLNSTTAPLEDVIASSSLLTPAKED